MGSEAGPAHDVAGQHTQQQHLLIGHSDSEKCKGSRLIICRGAVECRRCVLACRQFRLSER